MASNLLRIGISHSLPPPSPAVLKLEKIISRQNATMTSLFPATSLTSDNPLPNFCGMNTITVRPPFPYRRRSVVASAVGPKWGTPLISPEDQWGNWTALFAAAAVGIWSEKTKIGSALSGCIISIWLGLAGSNLGIIACQRSPAYAIVMEFLLPLAIPLLLFRADLRHVINSTGRLLFPFLLGTERTKIGSALSGSVVCMWLELAGSNLGIIGCQRSPASAMVMEFLLPLSIPLMLLRADLRHVISPTGKLLFPFLLASVATTIGTAVAYLVVPMRSLGEDSWKIAAALMGRHIGGAVNYVAIADALGVSPSVLTAGLAADNILAAVYFSTLFALASKVPPEADTSVNDDGMKKASEAENKLPVLKMATALAVAFAICKAGIALTNHFKITGGSLPSITAIVVILATMFSKQFIPLAPSGEAMAVILMQVFFVVIGATGSLSSVMNTAPSIFMFVLVQMGTHLGVILGLGKLFGCEYKLLLMASNANVGGPTTACGMATTKGWPSLAVPGILAGILGISIATFLSIGFGLAVLKRI